MKKNKETKKNLAVRGAFFCGLLAGAVLLDNNRLTVSGYDLGFSNLPDGFDGFKILHLSDLHSKEFGRGNHRLESLIERLSPDLAVMTGDMVNGNDESSEVLLDLVEETRRLCRVFYVSGNREQKRKALRLPELHSELSEKGAVCLDDRVEVIKRRGDMIRLCGLGLGLEYYKRSLEHEGRAASLQKRDIEETLGACEGEMFSILLAHSPVYFDAYAGWGADLTLCGHMHGGAVRIPGVGGVFSPEIEFFPEYDAGVFEKNGKKMVVSRGLGKSAVPRILNPPEVVLITLRRAAI